MSFQSFSEDDEQRESHGTGGRRGGSRAGSDPSADSTGGRSTGPITGFGGGSMGGGGSGGGGGGGGRSGSVVKASYTKAGGAKSTTSMKASARYYTTRENERGESMERESFSHDRDDLSREEVYERLERADQEHEYHYRVVVSPGTDREAEGVDLKEYTREVMREVDRQQGGGASWVAVEHGRDTAHTERAHVHVMVSTNQKMNRDDLSQLREHATRSWDEARDHSRSLERDPTIERDIRQMARAHEERERNREQPTRERSSRESDPTSQNTTRNDRGNAPQAPERQVERSYEHDWGRSR